MGETYIEAVPKLQSLPFRPTTRWSKQALPSLPEHAANEEVHERRDD